MEEARHRARPADSLLACCLCRRQLRDPVQLTCLHECCRKCLKAARNGSGQDIVCGSCSARMCALCSKYGMPDKPALVQCPACRRWLCEYCTAVHKQYCRLHVTQPLDVTASLEEACMLPSAASCPIHKKPLEIACIPCELSKCSRRWVQCKENEMLAVGQKPFDSYVRDFIACVSSMESEFLQKAKILEQPKRVQAHMRTARTHHLEQINLRKQQIVDAVKIAYSEIEWLTKHAYDDLQGEGDVVAVDADRIASNHSDARNYVTSSPSNARNYVTSNPSDARNYVTSHPSDARNYVTSNLSDARNYSCRLVESKSSCEILKQQKAAKQDPEVVSAELDSRRGKPKAATSTVEIGSSLPDDLDIVVKSRMGTSARYSAATAHDCLKRDFGYEFKGGLLLNTISGRRFEFKSQDEYEQMGLVVNEYVYSLLEGEGLELRMLKRHKAAAAPKGFFFASKDVDINTNGILVLIHGSGAVRAGQWSRSLIINQSVESGSQLPYIQEAKRRRWSVVVMNTNQYNDSYRCCKDGEFFAGYNPEDHAVRAWKAAVDGSPAQHVAIVAHSYGGQVTSCLLQKMGSAFKKKVVAIALTDSYCFVRSSDQDYFKKVAKNWVTSKLPVGESVGYAFDCERVSAGTTVHEETSWKSMKSVFAFIEKKFLPAAGGDRKSAASVCKTETHSRYY